MTLDLRLAAIITLLSASALRGVTVNKAAALRAHLAAAADAGQPINPHLKDALEQTLAGWQALECHPDSISVDYCALTVAGQMLH